jgi:hypothetical protein
MAIFKGICQYGLDKMDFFLNVMPHKIHGKVYDHIMNCSLLEFKNKFQDQQAIFHRFKALIVNNKSNPRYLCAWYGNHRMISIIFHLEYEEKLKNEVEQASSSLNENPHPLNYR